MREDGLSMASGHAGRGLEDILLWDGLALSGNEFRKADMVMTVEFVSASAGTRSVGLVIALLEPSDGGLPQQLSHLDDATKSAIADAMASARLNKRDLVLDLGFLAGFGGARVVLIGPDLPGAWTDRGLEEAAARAVKFAMSYRAAGMEMDLLHVPPTLAARAAFGARLAAYRFRKYHTDEHAPANHSLGVVRIMTTDCDAAGSAFRALSHLADAVCLARDLVSEPANILFPAEMADRVLALEQLGLEIEILGEAEMEKLNMGALLGVGQGSSRESKLVVLQWRGGPEGQAPLAFVGKGVCFDSGGITLKQGLGLERMKWDMAGAAAVTGLMRSLAGRKAEVNVVGVLALVENMPGGNAQRPGDIVRSMSGQTIEVINTDSEGRLILADALWYCQDRFRPEFMVDIATLTGNVLSSEYAALMANDDVLAGQLISAGEAEGERLWRLPLPPKHEEHLKSLVADIRNHVNHTLEIGGGTITGGQFIQRFVNGSRWAHLDIAGVAWRNPSNMPTVPNGASGYGVRLLDRLVSYYEQCS